MMRGSRVIAGLVLGTLTLAEADAVARPRRPPAVKGRASTTRGRATPGFTPATSTLAAAGSTPTAVGAEGLGDGLFPADGNGGYDVLDYNIAVRVAELPSGPIQGTATIRFVAKAELQSFNLDLHGLDVASVRVGPVPRPAEATDANWRRSGDELTITPVTALHTGTEYATTIVYSGVPQIVPDGGSPIGLGWQPAGGQSAEGRKATFVISEPNGAKNWFPCNDHPLDKSTFTIRIDVPKPYQAIANGTLVGSTPSANGTQYEWRMNQPMATYLATVHVGEFENVRHSGARVPVADWYLRGATFDRTAFTKQPAMLTWFESLVGPYPFDSYGAVVTEGPRPLALETQSLSSFFTRATSEAAVVHELSHQWFGDSVSVGRWDDVWLNEGFATYMERMWKERTIGPVAFEENMQAMYGVVAGGGTGPVRVTDRSDLFGRRTYFRGALVLHALRRKVGDAKFVDVLRAYYARFAGRNATSEDFLAVVGEVGGVAALDTVRHWAFDLDVPPYE
jgi:aminopeptidase N